MRRPRILLLGLLALVVTGAVVRGAAASPGTTERVSVDSAGNEADGGECPTGGFSPAPCVAISGDGRYVAFQSDATNLIAGDTNNRQDVFAHDRQTQATTRVSVDSSGNQANDHSFEPAISGDGRFIAFYSFATDLVAGDFFFFDVFVHDRQTGATTMVSVDSAGNQANDFSFSPAISGDGRYVAFHSRASNLVTGDTNSRDDVFVHDRQSGTTTIVSVDSTGSQGNGSSFEPAISADGRFVAFRSLASTLVAGDTNGIADVFVHDRQTQATTRVSVDSAGNQGNNDSSRPTISGDGRYVAFDSFASNLVAGDTNEISDVFAHDRQTQATTRVSVDSAGNQGNLDSLIAAISGDGRFIAFASAAPNLVAGDTNFAIDVFVHDRQTGATVRVSVDSAGNQGNSHSYRLSISSDGRFVVFGSLATNLVAGDTNGTDDAFVHDLGDADGDGEWDPFDPCPANPDCDGDGWTDAAELHIGTDPLNPGTPGGWPPDPAPEPDGNCAVQIDDVTVAAVAFGSTTTPRAEIATQNGIVQIDDVAEFAIRFGDTCP